MYPGGEHAGDVLAAMGAVAVPEVIHLHRVPAAPDKQVAAIGTASVGALTVDVSHVGILNAGLQGGLPGSFQRSGRSSGKVP